MRHLNLILGILILLHVNSVAQSDKSTTYRNLKTKKFYVVNISSQTKNNKEWKYEVNGKSVSKSVYKKYKSYYKNIKNCCPCILKSYSETDILIREQVSCHDCGVGWFKDYSPDGKLILIGNYKENPSGNWSEIWQRGFCSVQDGKWTYFDKNGDTLYSEFWEAGKFIKQIPEQKHTEIWNVELTLKGEKIEKQLLKIEQIRDLIVTPNYKNSNRENINLTINFEVSAIGHKSKKTSYSIDNFKNIDLTRILSEVGIKPGEEATYLMEVCNNGSIVAEYYLNIDY